MKYRSELLEDFDTYIIYDNELNEEVARVGFKNGVNKFVKYAKKDLEESLQQDDELNKIIKESFTRLEIRSLASL